MRELRCYQVERRCSFICLSRVMKERVVENITAKMNAKGLQNFNHLYGQGSFIHSLFFYLFYHHAL